MKHKQFFLTIVLLAITALLSAPQVFGQENKIGLTVGDRSVEVWTCKVTPSFWKEICAGRRFQFL